jgi:rare lipoprotein A
MGRAGGGQIGRIARIGAVVLGCLALADCSASKVFSDKYSERVVADGQPVPKGGGAYRVGQPYTINGQTYHPNENASYRAEGIASWYGPDFHGRLTANGEVFDMRGISAAHPTMPLPSYARVTNLNNGRSIIVRVNDRGPYARNRLIDVSIGAANALGFYGDGLAHVRVEYVGRAPLEGSDDRVLLATLREGRPAPVPPQLMVASTEPFVPGFGDDGGAPPIPPERPFALGGGAGRVATKPATVAVASATAVPERSVVRLPTGAQKAGDVEPAPRAQASPVATYAPARNDGVLGLMSGRGLY